MTVPPPAAGSWPPESAQQQQHVIAVAARKYQRAGQVVADAARAMLTRLVPASGLSQDQAVRLVAEFVAVVSAEVLADRDI